MMLWLFARDELVSAWAPSGPSPSIVTFATAGANASSELKSSTGIVALSGSAGVRRTMSLSSVSASFIPRVLRVARIVCGSSVRSERTKLWSPGKMNALENPPLTVAPWLSPRPAMDPRIALGGVRVHDPGNVFPNAGSSAGAPYETLSVVRPIPNRCPTAIPPRLAAKVCR